MSDENKEKCAKKKLLIILTVIAIILSSAALILDGIIINKMVAKDLWKAPVVISKQYDKGQSMEKALKTKKPVIMWFYTDWCGFCQRFAPTFGKITKNKDIKKAFAIAYINAEQSENHGLMTEYAVQGFPTIFLMNPETGEKVQISNEKLFTPDAEKELVEEFLEFTEKADNN